MPPHQCRNDQQARIKTGLQIDPRHGAKQQKRDRNTLSEFHQPVHLDLLEHPAQGQYVADADHDKNRQDDIDKVENHKPVVPVF